MKKVLITGAAGTIGRSVIKYLLSEGKYEITALDIKTSNNKRYLNKYKKRINIVYGDVNNSTLMESLIKEMNYVIHLASANIQMANLNNNLSYDIDYKGTENIVRLLNFYNPDCHLLYASSASVYGKQDKDYVSVSTKPNLDKNDLYATYKLEAENIIKKKLTNYSIYRLPIILCNPIKDNYIYSYSNDTKIETVTDIDVAYMFSRAIDKIDEVNKKTFNVGGGDNCRLTGKELNTLLLKTYGINNKYITNKLFLEKNFYSYYFKDSDKLENILSFRNDSVLSYFIRIKRRKRKYKIRKILAKPFIRKEKLDKNK